MGDEKTQAQPGGKKQDNPPAPVQQQTPKDQHTGPGPAKQGTEHKQATPAGQAAAMQQSVGNQQVNRILRAAREPGKDPHTPGLKVSHPEDAAEKEAEAVAKKVTGDQPAHPHDHPGPAPGDPAKVVGDPSKVHGDPDVVHRAVADHTQPTKPQPATQHPTAPAPQHPAPHGPSPTSALDHPGPGQPIPQPTRSTLEAKLKADLSHIVVHHNAEADKAVRALHARAVTRGNHIFLASDASSNDLSLMAHEATHVLQHNDDTVHRQPASPPTTPPKKPYYSGSEGIVDIDPTSDKDSQTLKTVEVAEVSYAAAKKLSKANIDGKFAAGSRISPPKRPPTTQDKNWTDELDKNKTAIEGVIDKIIAKGTAPLPPPPPNAPPTGTPVAGTVYLLRFSATGPTTGTAAAKSRRGVIAGTRDDLVTTAAMPYWDRNRKFVPFNVDHLVEMQVGGTDTFDNYWLWEAVANQNAGQLLRAEIIQRVNALLAAATAYYQGKPNAVPLPKNRSSLSPSTWRVKIGKLGKDFGQLRGNPNDFWTSEEVKKGDPANLLQPVTPDEARELGFYPSSAGQSYLAIIVGGKAESEGGAVIQVPWKAHQKEADRPALAGVFDPYYPHFAVTKLTYDTAKKSGQLTGLVSNKFKLAETKEIELPLTGFGSATGAMPMARLDGQKLATKVGFFHFAPMSEIMITQADLVPFTGFSARGVLKPSIPLLKNTSIDVVFTGDDISLQKTFSTKDIPAPAPLKITEGAITVSVGTNGFEVGGTLDFALGTFATGSISASVDAKLNFSLDGQIDFDKTLFNPATLDFYYRKAGSDYQWGVGGTLGIPPNKVPGIQQATIRASYANGTFTAGGDATLNVPGLQSGSLLITYAERDGISIGGSFGLAPNPVIESGTVAATVSKRPPGNRWALSASGTVKPKIPGVDTTLSASYEDGVFTVEGSVAYARGMLSGSLTVGLTNRPLDPQGHPAGAPRAGAPLRPYGGGTLTARITPWLQGTVGVQLQGDGSVQLMGEIALPDSVNLFDAMQVQKNLLNIGMDIPIVGVAVMGQRIGIFATIQGGLDASASVGPGQLRQLSLRVRYNPEHEDQTQITGGAQLFIPAQAGLRLYVRGALGAGIPVVSAEAGLEIGGQLGVEGAVQAGVTVNWTPKQGLVIDAQASLSAEPSFTFDINGYVKVGADLVFTSVTLYEKHWQLASFRYGSGLRVGVRAPIHYEQGKPFTFSLSDVQFDLPKIDPTKVLTDLVHQIA